jgi:protein TonB
MLVNPAAQERNLLRKVDPTLKAPGAVRVDVLIGRDGHVKTAKVISGDARLADAARAAVLQWTYRPTLSNGEPVEVRTEVDIRFQI